MLRWFLLVLALLVLATGSLTVFPSPDWFEWKIAVLAGEFGYLLAVVPLGLAAVAWTTRGRRPCFATVTALVCAGAIGLLVKPVIEAALIAQALPARLDAAFGKTSLQRPPFSPSALFARRTPEAVIETMNYGADLRMDYYRPAQPRAEPVPCVVVIHGGGWDSGDRTQLAAFNHWLALRGYGVAAVSYRLAPAFIWPVQYHDVLAALEFLKANAAQLGIDPHRLVLLGRSAGGQIAEVVAYSVQDPAIRGLVALYAPSDLNFGYAHAWEDDAIKSPFLMRQYLGGPPSRAQSNYDSASALAQVTAKSPPTLLLHGQLDRLVWHRHSERLAATLAEKGVKHLFVSLPWAAHAFDVNLGGPGGQLTSYAIESFLAAVTQPAAKPREPGSRGR